RKARRPQKHSRAETNVLNKFVGPSPDALLARSFLDLFDAAKFAQGGVARVGRGHSGGNVPLSQKIDMLLNFFGHLSVPAIFGKQSEQPREPSANLRHKLFVS